MGMQQWQLELEQDLMHCSNSSNTGILLLTAAVIILLAWKTKDGTKSKREKLELFGKNISAVQLKLNQCSQEVKVKESELIDWERKLAAPLRRRHNLELEARKLEVQAEMTAGAVDQSRADLANAWGCVEKLKKESDQHLRQLREKQE